MSVKPGLGQVSPFLGVVSSVLVGAVGFGAICVVGIGVVFVFSFSVGCGWVVSVTMSSVAVGFGKSTLRVLVSGYSLLTTALSCTGGVLSLLLLTSADTGRVLGCCDGFCGKVRGNIIVRERIVSVVAISLILVFFFIFLYLRWHKRMPTVLRVNLSTVGIVSL